MAVFRAFKPTAMNKIAQAMGYTGDMGQFQNFIEQDPARQARMKMFEDAAMQMARGGVVKMQQGGLPSPVQVIPQASVPGQASIQNKDIGDIAVQRAFTPGIPTGAVTTPVAVNPLAQQDITPGVGAITGNVAVDTAVAQGTVAATPTATDAAEIDVVKAAQPVGDALNAIQAQQLTPDDTKTKIVAAEKTETAVADVEAAKGQSIKMENPVDREIQQGELISGAADAEKASKFVEQIEAATTTPTKEATVKGQLESLMQDFEGGETPVWARGALRSVTARMAERGLGASSISAQAMVQAAMESALPIAQADAQVQAQFQAQNLSNKQQRAMLAAEQRAKFMGMEFDQAFQARVQNAAKVSDVANINFTAEQQVALENSRIANTTNLQNLTNSQAVVMAEAAALANLETATLNNQQQAAVQNAQNFLNTEMTNFNAKQQTEMFKAQQRIQSLFTDQAADNAARQFNASSQNQVDQFFASLNNQASQFNASQINAQTQFNAGQRNTVERFNAELNNQRDQFNATNQLAIAQSNAVWRREIATAATAAVNRANEINAQSVLDISKSAYDNLWNYYADTMEWAWTSAENEQNRIADMAIATLNADERAKIAEEQSKSDAGAALGGLVSTLGAAFIKTKFCWVASEVYGQGDPRLYAFRIWLKYKAPKWLYNLYGKYGEDYARFISNKPALKWITRKLMDRVVDKTRKLRYAYN